MVESLDTPHYVLAEGPVWDAASGRLSWIDIDDGLVMSAAFGDGRLGDVTTLHVGGSVGCALPIDGGYLVALESWLGILSADGRLDKSRALLTPNRRFNDGKIDPQGRLVVGSLRRFGPADGRQELVRLEHDGSLTRLDDDINLSNGLGWSPDGAVLYHAESFQRLIYARGYVDGVPGARSILIELEGMPDGLTVDADGRLWITQMDLNRVDCFAPDGTRLDERTIELGDLHPTSVEFAGPGLDELVITTGFPVLETPPPVERDPRDGGLLVTRVGAVGMLPTAWTPAPLPR
jgi:sugar lactone lactonase YvrE